MVDLLKVLGCMSAKKITIGIAVSMSIFQIFSSITTVDTFLLRTSHVSFALALAFLLKNGRSEKREEEFLSGIDYIFLGLTLFVAVYPVVNFERLVTRWPYVSPLIPLDYIFGFILLCLVIEASRRMVGWILPIIGVSSLLYVYFGPWLPQAFKHRGFSVKWIVDHMTLYTEGVFGMPVGVSATFAFLFILFGAILFECGAAPFFFDLSQALFGKQRGGVGKVAVIASGLMGTVTGSSPGNVFATGTLTIPMMKKTGFKPAFAAGVEAAASTGGQIMPPVMGSAAFLMAEFLGISYGKIIIMAVIPALLYYVSIFTTLHVYSLRNGLQGASEVPSIKEVSKRLYYLLPLGFLIGSLMLGYSTTRSILISIIIVSLIPLIQQGPQKTLAILFVSMNKGAQNAVGLAVSCAVAGIFMGALSITGLGFKLTRVLLSLAGGTPWLIVLFVIVAVMIMGMGMPTPAAYAFAAALAAPVLIELGYNTTASHFFVLYYASFSSITPPIALAAYAAASIAGTDFTKTGFQALLVGAAGLLIPLQFLVEPQLLLLGVTSYTRITIIIAGSLVGVSLFACALQGWFITRMNLIERLILLSSAVLLINTNIKTDLLGVFFIALIVFSQISKRKKYQ